MRFAWLKKLGEKFYAYTHSDGVVMSDGGNLTNKIKEIVSKLQTHHHHAADINDIDDRVKSVIKTDAPPKSHATNATTYGVATGSAYGHVRIAGNTPAANQYVLPFSTQYASAQSSLNITNMLYNGIYAVRFTGSATGAPSGLTAGTTYYGTILTMNFAQTSSVSSTYGVTQILSIPKAGKLYFRFVTSSSAYGSWVDLTAIASGYA